LFGIWSDSVRTLPKSKETKSWYIFDY
jgi:hypothetical protein